MQGGTVIVLRTMGGHRTLPYDGSATATATATADGRDTDGTTQDDEAQPAQTTELPVRDATAKICGQFSRDLWRCA